MKIKKFFQNIAGKLISILEKVRGNTEEVEEMSPVNPIEEKKSHKFFGRTSFFDDLKKIDLEILPIKKYSKEMYQKFKDKVDALSKDIKIFYEEQETKQEFTLKLTMGVTDYSKDINQRIYRLLEEVKEFKRTDYNYEYAKKSLEKLKELLNNNYLFLLSDNSDTELLNKAYYGTMHRLDEIACLDLAENTVKKEEISKLMCECLYIFLKCNARCGFIWDIDEIKQIFEVEKNAFWETFIANTSDLYQKLEIFKEEKYVKRYAPYLLSILEKNDILPDFLMRKSFLEHYVETEKKILELHHYFSNHPDYVAKPKVQNAAPKLQNVEPKIQDVPENIEEDVQVVENPNMVNVTALVKSVEPLLRSKDEDMTAKTKLYLLRQLLVDFEHDITNYEVYKMVYFFGLKTYFVNYVSKAEENDIMKKVFLSQKDTKITPPKKGEAEEEMFTLFKFDMDNFNPEWVRKILKKSGIFFEEVESLKAAKIHEIHFSAKYFEDCENVMRNLREFKSI